MTENALIERSGHQSLIANQTVGGVVGGVSNYDLLQEHKGCLDVVGVFFMQVVLLGSASLPYRYHQKKATVSVRLVDFFLYVHTR